jgi:hypothetical protein
VAARGSIVLDNLSQKRENSVVIFFSLQKKMSECPICFYSTYDEDVCTYGPCNHKFCKKCVQRWLKYDVRCPICRTVAQTIDPPADPLALYNKTLTIQLDGTGKLGVNLDVKLFSSISTVQVKSFSANSLGFRQGLRVNDTIVCINSIPCRSISMAQQLLVHGSKTAVHIQIFRTPKRKWFRSRIHAQS